MLQLEPRKPFLKKLLTGVQFLNTQSGVGNSIIIANTREENWMPSNILIKVYEYCESGVLKKC